MSAWLPKERLIICHPRCRISRMSWRISSVNMKKPCRTFREIKARWNDHPNLFWFSLLTFCRFYAQISQLKKKQQLELGKLGREYDQRMLTLMQQLPPCGLKESAEHKVITNCRLTILFSFYRLPFFFQLQISGEDLMERLKIQQKELERCCTLQQQLNAALDEIEQLKSQKKRPASPEMK